MTWWLRFLLGLPARAEDVEEIRRSLPELLTSDFDAEQRLVLPWPGLFVGEFSAGDLRRWAGAADFPRARQVRSPHDCPAEECPLRTGPRAAENQDELVALEFMVAGGAHKPPKDEFLDLVRRVHKDQRISEVILTDPYIYLDSTEGEHRGGYSALVEYLKALGLTRESTFRLSLNPNPRKAGKAARQVLEREVRHAFPNGRVGAFKRGYRFHDRFYLAREQSGRLSGVFGPSLNGLGARSVVLMGELERSRALERLEKLL